MKLGRFKECFDICVNEIKDIQFAQRVAKIGFEWHDKDRLIYYNLFKRLILSSEVEGQEGNKVEAIRILTKNCSSLPFEKITKNFKEDEPFTEDVNFLYQKIFMEMDKKERALLTLKNITEMEAFNQEMQKFEFMMRFVQVSEDNELGTTMCAFCDKPIQLSNFQFNPEKGTIVHSYHYEAS